MFDDVPLEHEYHNLGNDFYRLGQYDKAVDYYAKALELNPSLTESYFNRALAYARLGEYEAALTDATRVINLDRSLHDAFYLRGRIHELSLDDTAAATDYAHAIELHPAFGQANEQLRLIRTRAWIYDELRNLRDQIELEPGNGYLRYQNGQRLAMIGHHDDAVRALEMARANGFIFPDLWVELGQAYVAQGRSVPGMAAFRQAIRLDPTNVTAHAHLGQLLAEAGHHRDAVSVFSAALAMPNSDRASLLCGLGTALTGLRRWDEAERSFREAMNLGSRFAEAAYGLGMVAWRQGRTDMAIQWCRRALESTPRMTSAVILAANIAIAQNDLPRATKLAVDAVQASPQDERLAYLLWTLSSYAHRYCAGTAAELWKPWASLVESAGRIVRERVNARNELTALQRDISDQLLAACPVADEIAEVAYQKLVARPRSVLGVLYEELRRPGVIRPVERLRRAALFAQSHDQGWLSDVCASYASLLAGSPEAPHLDGVLRALGRLVPLAVNHADVLVELYRVATDGLAAESVDDILGLRPRIERLALAAGRPGFVIPEIGALLVDFVNWLDMVERAVLDDVAGEWTDLADLAADLRSRINRAVSAPEQWVLATMLTHFGTIVRAQVVV